MDEISNGLDYDMVKTLKNTIINWSKDMTILLTGHQFDFYNDIINDLFVFKDGKISLLKEDFCDGIDKLEVIYDEELH